MHAAVRRVGYRRRAARHRDARSQHRPPRASGWCAVQGRRSPAAPARAV